MLDSTAAVVTVVELAHGITRSDTTERRDRRQRLLEEILTSVPIQPVTVPIALRAGRIDGQSQAKGVRIPLSDLLIGVSALELGYGVGTANGGFAHVSDCLGSGESLSLGRDQDARIEH